MFSYIYSMPYIIHHKFVLNGDSKRKFVILTSWVYVIEKIFNQLYKGSILQKLNKASGTNSIVPSFDSKSAQQFEQYIILHTINLKIRRRVFSDFVYLIRTLILFQKNQRLSYYSWSKVYLVDFSPKICGFSTSFMQIYL